jgi:hypothetical protein
MDSSSFLGTPVLWILAKGFISTKSDSIFQSVRKAVPRSEKFLLKHLKTGQLYFDIFILSQFKEKTTAS